MNCHNSQQCLSYDSLLNEMKRGLNFLYLCSWKLSGEVFLFRKNDNYFIVIQMNVYWKRPMTKASPKRSEFCFCLHNFCGIFCVSSEAIFS